MREPRVILVSPSDRFDLSGAERYGAIEYVFRGPISAFNVDRFIKEAIRELEALDFDPDRDFFALTGHALEMSMMSMVLAVRYSKLHLLLFQAKTGQYEHRIFNTKGIERVNSRRTATECRTR